MTDFELVINQNKTIFLRVSLLNDAYQEVRALEGEMLEMSFSVSSDSAIRRVANASLYVNDSSDLGKNYFGMWMDRMIRLQYGLWDPALQETRWFLLGSFLFTASGYRFDASSRVLSLSIADMMAAATEDRGTQLGTDVEYVAGSVIKDALAATVGRFSPYKRYNIVDFEDVIPYDITIAKGNAPYEALRTIVELFPWYEQFYSREGIYTVRRLSTANDDPVVLTADQMNQIVISENGDLSYSDVKNITEIWGKEIDAGYTAIKCESVGSTYKLTIHSTYEKNEEGALICFTPDKDSVQGQMVQVQELEACSLYIESGDGTKKVISAGALQADRAYVIKYIDGAFVLQGESQIHVMCMEYSEIPSDDQIEYLKSFHNCNDIEFVINPESPFACDVIHEAKQVLCDGDFSNIYTTQLAFERASYENWKRTRLQDTITIEALFVPWLDVNDKVEYTSIATGVTAQYTIKEIQTNFNSGVMTLTMVRFYPLYPWLE